MGRANGGMRHAQDVLELLQTMNEAILPDVTHWGRDKMKMFAEVCT